MELKRVDRQVVVVVGASSGIGREAASMFARGGARVVVSARSREGLDTLVEEIRREGGEATAVPADAAESQEMERLAGRAVELYGRIDTWLHAAAVSLYARFEDTTPDEFRRVVEVDLLGQAFGAMAALPWLRREGRGALIHVSSVEGLRALPYQAAYGASKHGIVGMLEALRLELQEEGAQISVTNVMPSSVDTPLFDKARTKLGVKPKGVPPIYRPATVARAILHAAERPTRDIVVGGGGRALAFAQAASPRLVDAWLLRQGFAAQRDDAWRSVHHPDNLEEPVGGHDRVHGSYGGPSRERSYTTSYARAGAGGRSGAALAALAAILVGSLLVLRGRG